MSERVAFDAFFSSGREDYLSPFLTPSSRHYGKNLALRSSLVSCVCLASSFALSFSQTTQAFSHLLLMLVYLLAGIPKLIEALDDLLSFDMNIDVLMTLAAFLSVLLGNPFEGGLLLVLFALSSSMEESVRGKARGALRTLHALAPTRACVIGAAGRLHERHVGDICVGTTLLVRSGEIIPLDGEVLEGTSSVDLVHLTGESVPLRKSVGDEVPAGARVIDGSLSIQVTRTSSDSTLARIIELVTKAQEKRPRAQSLLDRWGRTYAVSVICAAFFIALLLPLVSSIPYLSETGSIYRSLAFLIAASPCALILSLPISYLSAISACARKGILVKGGIALDALASCSSVAFDKTGTLTTGQLECLGFTPVEQRDRERANEALQVALALEMHAHHPIAKAIMALAEKQGATPASTSEIHLLPGYGVEGTVTFAGREAYAYVGHPDHLRSRLESKTMLAIDEASQAIRLQGQLLSTLVIGESVWLLKFQDSPRPAVGETVAHLKERLGLRVLMLTGDAVENAESVASLVGIDETYANLRPSDKLDHVSQLTGRGLAMVGDGVNDAPALARATCGISLGGIGSQTAIQAADVVLLRDDLSLLPWLWKKAATTRRIVKQNLILALLAIVAASSSALAGWIPLWLAVILHEGGTVLVALNSLRLLK